MIVTVDSSSLALLINPDAKPPLDPSTGQLVTHPKERIEGLVADLASGAIVIPTPVLAETLVAAEEAGPDLLQRLQSYGHIRIMPFDERAAVETALMTAEALRSGDKKGASTQPWQKVKFDRQILAVARVAGSDLLYSDDTGLCSFARSVGMAVISTWNLSIPDRNGDLFD